VLAPLYLPYLAHNFSAEKQALTRGFLYLLTPWLVTSGAAMFIGYVLNSIEKFAVPALVPILTPIATLACIISWARPATGYSLAAGAVAGSLLEAALLCWLVKRHELLGAFRWYGFSERVREVLAQTGPMMAGCLLMGATPLVDQYMASMLAPGSVAALSYGSKVTAVLFAIGATALSTATLPYFSKMTAEGDWLGCRHTLRRYSALILAIGVPVTALLVVCSRPVIRLLFERGAFTGVDTDVVSRVQAFYCLQIPFYALCVLFVRFISSVRRNDLLMYASAINLVVNVTMNLILMRWFGVAGIALSTSIVMVCSFTFLFLSARRLLGRRPMIDVPVPATVGQ
jgi:putative peptidoglycan lipid II flippase